MIKTGKILWTPCKGKFNSEHIALLSVYNFQLKHQIKYANNSILINPSCIYKIGFYKRSKLRLNNPNYDYLMYLQLHDEEPANSCITIVYKTINDGVKDYDELYSLRLLSNLEHKETKYLPYNKYISNDMIIENAINQNIKMISMNQEILNRYPKADFKLIEWNNWNKFFAWGGFYAL